MSTGINTQASVADAIRAGSSLEDATKSTASQGVESDARHSILKQRWEDALEICRETLGEKDYDAIFNMRSSEELLQSLRRMCATYASRRIPQLLRRIEPFLPPLQKSTHAIAMAMKTHPVQTGVIWGLVNLLIEVASRSEAMLSNIVDMLEEINRDLDILLLYHIPGVANIEAEQLLVEVFVDILNFWSQTVKFLRRHPIENIALAGWPLFSATDLAKTSSKIHKSIEHFERKNSVLEFRQQKLGNNDRMSIVDKMSQLEQRLADKTLVPKAYKNKQGAKLPCHWISMPENPHFFARPTLMNKVRAELDFHDPQRHRSLAIWGTGGIGKTQIALAYAYERKAKGTMAVFWVNCETPIDTLQSFTNIALALKLEGAASGDKHESNRLLVTQWLQNAEIKWLLIFDNVEDFSSIQEHWPASGYGSTLITTRYDIVFKGPIAQTLQIPLLEKTEGQRFLFEFLRDCMHDPKEDNDERRCAEALSDELGGLPLALTAMAMQIRQRNMKVSGFLPFYRNHVSKLHELHMTTLHPYYKRSLKTAWDLAFDLLSEDATRPMFSILSYLAPDAIPITTFVPHDDNGIPSELRFCQDSWKMEEAITALLRLSLIKRDPETCTIGVHRVIQVAFRISMSDIERKNSFRNSAKLLLASFPKLVNGLSLRKMWPTCEKYISHVIALGKCSQEIIMQPGFTDECQEFVECAASACWYLREIGSYQDCLDLIRVAFAACVDKTSLLYANLQNTFAGVELRRNHLKTAFEAFQLSMEIREKLLPPDHEELANIYNNLGNAYKSDCKFDEALRLYNKAVAIDMKKPIKERDQILHIRHLNIGSAYAQKGDIDQAKRHIEIGRTYAVKHFGDGTHYEAIADWTLAYIDYMESRWDLALDRYERVYRIHVESNKWHPFTCAATYKLACVAMKKSEYKKAFELLEKTLLIAQYNEDAEGDGGGVARVLRKMADCLSWMGKSKEAEDYHRRAETIRNRIQNGQLDRGDDEQSYDMLVSTFYR